ncbi:hypothetical protein GGD50_000143 [Rhizobium paranaense]|uniref:Uncharacterized protein n=1 Tax=Rhizobium paranaense TaxID=1650438 RepID=A0A7W8XLF6_9HYPH|nr:hypothetical protein [Rhizobium paranaense]
MRLAVLDQGMRLVDIGERETVGIEPGHDLAGRAGPSIRVEAMAGAQGW